MSVTGLAVLLVEDNVVHRDLWTKALARDGFDVTAVGSCAEAIGCVSRMVFDVLVLDHDIPGGTGLMVLEYARRHGVTTPALIVSGIATREDYATYAGGNSCSQGYTAGLTCSCSAFNWCLE